MLIVTHARIYYAPVGSGRPDPNFPVGHLWSAPWTDIGFTSAPVAFAYEQSEVNAMVEQHLAPVNRFKSKIAGAFKTVLAETSALNHDLAWDGVTSSQSESDSFTIGDNRFMKEFAWGIEGEALDEQHGLVPMRLFIPRGTAIIGGSELWAKAGVTGTPLTIAALASPDTSAVIYDPFYVVACYVACRRGVFVSLDWAFDATQPHWVNITYNLPAHIGGIGILQMVCNPFSVSDTQICLLDDISGRSVWRRQTDAAYWTQILTAEQMRVGLGWPSMTIQHIGVNWYLPGCFYATGSTDLTEGGNGIAITFDYGDTWQFVRTASSIYNYGCGNVFGVGRFVFIGQNVGIGGFAYVGESGDWGATWNTRSQGLGISAWQPIVQPTPDYHPQQLWTVSFYSAAFHAIKMSQGVFSVHEPAYSLNHADDFFSAACGYASAPKSRRRVSVSGLDYTENEWETFGTRSLPFANGAHSRSLLYGQLAFGTTANQHVWATPDDGLTVSPKAGTNWNRPDLSYADAIPETAGGVAWEAIWFDVARMHWWPS